jgi:hypothetical protein
MVGDTNVRAGQCHCGAVRFEVTLSDGFNSIRRCTCSCCRMRGAVVVMAEMGAPVYARTDMRRRRNDGGLAEWQAARKVLMLVAIQNPGNRLLAFGGASRLRASAMGARADVLVNYSLRGAF